MSGKKYLIPLIAGLILIPTLWMISRAVRGRVDWTSREGQIQLISRKQGWQLANIEARERARESFGTHKEPSEQDWQTLVQAADLEGNDFDLSLIMIFAEEMNDKYRAPVLKWCERKMVQTTDQYAAVLGYYGYVRSEGPDKETWAKRLKERGAFYITEVAKADQRAADRKARDLKQKALLHK